MIIIRSITKIMAITSLSQLDPNGSNTCSDYLLWQFEERIEIFRSKIAQMSALGPNHQQISMRLSLFLGTHFGAVFARYLQHLSMLVCPVSTKQETRRSAPLYNPTCASFVIQTNWTIAAIWEPLI